MDLFVIGPNGFHRRLSGRSDIFSVSIERGSVAFSSLRFENLTDTSQSIAVTDRAYGSSVDVISLADGAMHSIPLDLTHSHGWYDRQFVVGGQAWRMAGHIENGEASYSDPSAGGPGPLRLGPTAQIRTASLASSQ